MTRDGTQWLKYALMFILVALSSPSWGAITVSASGASKISGTTHYYSNISATQTVSAGGGACSTLVNPNCKISTDTFTIAVTVTGFTTVRPLYLIAHNAAIDTSGTNISGHLGKVSQQNVTANGTYTFTPTFASICDKASDSSVTVADNCDDNAGEDAPSIFLNIILDNDGSNTANAGDDIASITLRIQSTIPVNSSTGEGLYQFTMFPGDEKAYVRDVRTTSEFPSSTNAIGVEFVRLYYTTGTDDCSAAGFANVDQFHSAPFANLNPDQSTGQLSPTFVSGLTNNVTYYFRTALVDFAGNIGYLISSDDSSHCAKPDEVIGLLASRTNCFIATAAYGSESAFQVKILRDFRDRILLKSKVGKKFVRLYYRHSPAMAGFIEDKPTIKALVRGVLYPIVGYSFFAIKFGAVYGSLLFSTLLLLPLLFWRWWKMRERSA